MNPVYNVVRWIAVASLSGCLSLIDGDDGDDSEPPDAAPPRLQLTQEACIKPALGDGSDNESPESGSAYVFAVQ